MTLTMKQARVGVDLTQAATAAKLGVSANTYASWENQTAKMPIDKALKFAEVVGLTVNDICWK